MAINNGSPSLEDIRGLLERDGRHPVLLYIPIREKGPRYPWRKTTYEETQLPEYQKKLNAHSNTGVRLGEDDLNTVDLDTEAALIAFLEDNPAFAGTLCTAGGAEGGQFWFYALGERPHQVHRIMARADSPLAVGARGEANQDGLIEIGEYRAEGGQSVVRGVHPSERHYRLRQAAAPIQFAVKNIVWRADFILPWRETPPKPAAAAVSSAQGGYTEDRELLHRAIALLNIDFLWNHFRFPERHGNPVTSPFFPDDVDESFSVSKDSTGFFDHDPGRPEHRGDSFQFFQLASGLDRTTALSLSLLWQGSPTNFTSSAKPL
jgi:hypothetical protein